MKKIVKADARIEKIKKEHSELLMMVKGHILENKDCITEEINKVFIALDIDDENTKEYKSLIEAQELIISLIQQIAEAKSVEELVSIRKRINYYINKIKDELKKRNVEETTIEEYQMKAMDLRRSIAKYLRFLKREDNISNIDRLYGNYENLTIEELETLKKALIKETRYNSRNINSKTTKKVKATSPIQDITSITVTTADLDVETSRTEAAVLGELSNVFSSEETEEKVDLGDCHFSFDTEELSETNSGAIDFSGINIEQSETFPDFKEHKGITEVEFDEVGSFFTSRVNEYNTKYDIVETYDYYSTSVGTNIVNFFRNLPQYIHNKKSFKMMNRDYALFYRGSDLASFMEYVRRRNSIRQGLKCIFSRSYLKTEEARCLNLHDECSLWLFNFCKRNEMELPMQYGYRI